MRVNTGFLPDKRLARNFLLNPSIDTHEEATLTKKLVGPIRYYGGKCRLVSKLLPFVPDHQTYVEVFAGGAALFFAKNTSPVEVVNDLDSGIVNFYRVLRDSEKFKRFQFLVSLTPFSRAEHACCKASWADCDDDVE